MLFSAALDQEEPVWGKSVQKLVTNGPGKVCPLAPANSVPCSTTDLLRLGVQKSQDVGLYKTKSHSVIFAIPKVSDVITFSWSAENYFS